VVGGGAPLLRAVEDEAELVLDLVLADELVERARAQRLVEVGVLGGLRGGEDLFYGVPPPPRLLRAVRSSSSGVPSSGSASRDFAASAGA
jgi:hypothetical protein